MYAAALFASTLLAFAGARLYERCELARDLLKLGVRKDHIATWVCIAYHESRFDTAARNPNSGDHGLLQISEIYWCGAGKACGLPCSALRDDDISDDVECALNIYEEHTRLQGNGFLAWVVYPHYCKHNAKKYLANCDLSSKEANYKIEQRARSSDIYDTYPNIYVTSSIPVQSVSYPRSGHTEPVFLSIVSLLRGKFEQDFERDYNKLQKVNWSHFKIDNVDHLRVPDFNQSPNYKFLAPLTTQTSTTSTTTTEPEIHYKPVKPWRTIETNQFRRRMMSFNEIQTEKTINKSMNETFVEHTTPRSTTQLVSSTNLLTYTNISSSTEIQVLQKEQEKSNVTCCLNKNPTTILIITTPMPPTVLLNTSQKSSNYSEQSYPMDSSQKTHINITKRIQTFWENYGHLTTQTPNYKKQSFRRPVETTTLKPAVTEQLITQQNTIITPQMFATRSVVYKNKVNTDKNTFFNSNRDVTTSKGEETLYTIPYSTDLITEKPEHMTQRTTKTWTTQQPQYTQTNSSSVSENAKYSTEKPPTRGRNRFRTENQNMTKSNIILYGTTSRNSQSSTEPYLNRRVPTSETPKRTQTANSTLQDPVVNDRFISRSTPEAKAIERQEKTSTIATSTSPTTTKTTLSIFDLYLNPNKRPQTPNYKFLFSNNNGRNFKIFSGGTTSSPA